MYAVILTGGKQYKVSEGQVLRVEKLVVDEGATIEFDQVLMVGQEGDMQVGAPYVEGAKVAAEVVAQGRAKKIKIIKFKRRKQHMKRQGHRQYLTEIKIKAINA